MSKPLGLSVFLAGAVGFSSLAFAASGPQTPTPMTPPSSSSMQHGKWHGMHHRRDHRSGMGMLDKLDLTDTQRTNIRQMMRQSFEQARPEMQTLRQKRAAWESATPGSSAYQTATSELATAEANATRERVTRQAKLRTRIYGVLTSQQRTQLASLRAERQARMQKWRSEKMQHPGRAPASASSTR